MTKIVRAKYKISRRLGVNLWGRAKDPFVTKNYPPGQHGPTLARKVSDYGKQLQAKQRLKGYYGRISERQFANIFKQAIRMKGDSGENLIGLLEQRLDTVVFRLNVAPTIFAARQLVSHKHLLVNGKSVNIPSYRLKAGDVVEVREKSKQMPLILESVQKTERNLPEYIEFDPKGLKATFVRLPKLADVPYPNLMEPNLVIEYYSR
jgi:small subunit ribosomal protein S4